MPSLKNTERRGEREERTKRAKEWRGFRRHNLMTQKNLAEVCGISRRTIQEIENGRVIPRFSTQRKFIQFARNVERG